MTGGAAGPVRVAVVGCGAIGSLYAAHLARVPGVEVWAVDPWAKHVDAMEARGLRVTGLADFVAQVHARTDGGQSVGRVCTDPRLRQQVDRLVTEAVAVCERAGIVLTRPPLEAVDEAIAEAFEHKPSMLQDVLARRDTEIDVLNGGICAEGRRLGAPTPAAADRSSTSRPSRPRAAHSSCHRTRTVPPRAVYSR